MGQGDAAADAGRAKALAGKQFADHGLAVANEALFKEAVGYQPEKRDLVTRLRAVHGQFRLDEALEPNHACRRNDARV
jgi:hypothetical protein